MLFIVIHHFIVHAVFPESLDVTTPLSTSNISATIVNGFLFIAVNCFVLISGYYGIHLKGKSLINLYLTCALYGLLFYLLHLYVDNAHIGRSIIYNSLLIFSHGSWWFINAYVILMLMSPILNSAINSMNRRQHSLAIILLLFMQVYFGNFWQTDIYDNNGYHAFNFMLIYLVGQYLYRYVTLKWIDSHRWRHLGLYMICAICWAGLTIIDHIYPMEHWIECTYNNIFTLAGALFFFCFMLSFHFQSRFINWLAVSALAVYLAQDSSYSGAVVYNTAIRYSTLLGTTLMAKWVYILVISVAFFVIVLLVDKIRYYTFQWLFSWPITRKVICKCDKIFEVFEKK